MKRYFITLLIPMQLLSQEPGVANRFIDSLLEPQHGVAPATMIVVARDGQIMHKKAYGLASIEWNVPASTDHQFTLASVNKQMIAVCILQLAQAGKLSLRDDIRRHLAGFDTHGEIITVEHLLNHTSGINSANSPARGTSFFDSAAAGGLLSTEEFLKAVQEPPLLFKPGTDWSWNTWGYHLAFFIVEKVSGLPFNVYVKKFLFEPAGMHNSYSKVDANRLGANGIKNLNNTFYYPDADGKWIWRDQRRLTPFLFYQRYSIVTSLEDLVKWDQALRDGRLLKQEWLEKAWSAGKLVDGRSTHYGLGWVVSTWKGYRVLSHIGVGSNPICIVHVPDQKLYIACTQFFGSYEQVENKVKKILAKLLQQPDLSTVANSKRPGDYVGTYLVHRNGLDLATQIASRPLYLYVSAHNDTLFIRQTAGMRMMLRPAGIDSFFAGTSDNTMFIFHRDAKGMVSGITPTGVTWTYGPAVQNKKISTTVPRHHSAGTARGVMACNDCAGTYYLSSLDSYLYFESDSVKLYSKVQGKRFELLPLGAGTFTRSDIDDVEYTFHTTKSGGMELTVKTFRDLQYKKID